VLLPLFFFLGLVAPLRYALDKVKKTNRSTLFGGCATAQPSSSKGTPKGLTLIICSAIALLLRLPLHARIPSPRRASSSPGLRWLVKAATPPPVKPKKAFYVPKSITLFWLYLGCLLQTIVYQRSTLCFYAHFFRRLPFGVYRFNG
jgi:hypothetical protein